MATARRSTKQRGLAGEHQPARQQALATMAEGQLCARCASEGREHPMTRAVIRRSADGKRWVAPLLELDEFPGRAFGGPQTRALSWRRCNRRHGQRISTAIQNARRRQAGDPRYDRW